MQISIEINPLVLNDHNQFLALGAVIEVDDRALFRHAAIQDKREPSDESLLKKEAEKFGISHINLKGILAAIVNGDALGYAIKDMFFSQWSAIQEF